MAPIAGFGRALFLLLTLVTSSSCQPNAKQVLLELKTCNSTALPDWNERHPLSAWTGVKAVNDTVLALALSGQGLCGALPPAWSVLTRLSSLDLNDNTLDGPLPPAWSTLSSLTYLDLSFNSLNGSLPSNWSTFSALSYLDLYYNSLNGNLPPAWSALLSLTHLGLSKNSLAGVLPPAWSVLHSLRKLYVGSNALSSTLPPAWSLLSSLSHIYLPWNSLTGALPPAWSTLSAVTYLNMHDNFLDGTLPSVWSAMANLSILFLYQNSINGVLPPAWSLLRNLSSFDVSWNSLDTNFPPEWSTMTSLISLHLQGNAVNATLPAAWSTLSSLSSLWISVDTLETTQPASYSVLSTIAVLQGYSAKSCYGPLPTWLSKLTALNYLNMTGCNLSGALPPWVSTLVQLQGLDLSNNSVHGMLPSWMGGLTNLTSLMLDHNNFTGTLPTTWSSLVKLRSMVLEGNSLAGSLPDAWNSLASLTSLDLSNNRLSGTLHASWSQLSKLAIFKVGKNQLHGPIPSAWTSNMSWWHASVYLDISSNNLTGSLPIFSTTIQYLNASSNFFTGSIVSIPSSLVYLHLGQNSLSGVIPNITNSSLAFLDLSGNMFTQLPGSFQAPAAVYMSVARNTLHGTLPASGYNHSLIYCDLSYNNLTGSIPAVWQQHTWSYLGLDHNQLSGPLPDWSGNVALLLLQHNRFTGCIFRDVNASSGGGTQVISIASNNVTCLPSKWSAVFRNLSLLDVSDTATHSIPLSWIDKNAFQGNQTVLRAGRLWVSSARRSKKWQQLVCMKPDLNEQLLKSLNSIELAPGVQARIQKQIDEGLAELTATLRALNVTGTSFTIGRLQLRQDTLTPVTRQQICEVGSALRIIVAQWTIVGVALIIMCIMYGLECKFQFLKKYCGHSKVALDTRQRHVPKIQRVVSLTRSLRFFASLILYWYDVITDIVLITQVWKFRKAWPGYVLLGIFLCHYAVALALLAWRLDAGVCRKLVVLFLGLPVVPLLDSVMFIALTIEHHLSQQQRRSLAGMVLLQWEDMFEMREVLEVFMEAVPTSILQSVIFMMGNSPELGWFLDTRLYITSAVASCLQILRLVLVVLWDSLQEEMPPWVTLWRKVSLNWSGHAARGTKSSGTGRGENWSGHAAGDTKSSGTGRGENELDQEVVMGMQAL